MSKFQETLNKYYKLLEYASTGSFAQSGSSGLNPDASPIRPMPGTMDAEDMEKPKEKTQIRAGTPRSVAKLQMQDNAGDIRTTINNLAVGKPLTQEQQEIVSKIKFMVNNKVSKNTLNPGADTQAKLSKTVMNDDVETLNNPNRPSPSYAQS
jgi:signal recognition particle subunit SEC65